jgi:hypothetical protein
MQLSAQLDNLRKYRLFRRPENFDSPGQLIAWWEKRRIVYNLVVGASGLVTCGTLISIALLRSPAHVSKDADIGNPFVGIIVVILYAIMANVCYTAGWVTELIVTKVWGPQRGRYGEIVFSLGFAFSIALTLLPLVAFGPSALFSSRGH